MIGKLVYLKICEPYFSKKHNKQTDGGYELHILQDHVRNGAECGTASNKFFLKPNQILTNDLTALMQKIPCMVDLVVENELFGDRFYPKVKGVNFVKKEG